MPNIQIKDVPTATHAVLTRRAAEAGQSLQEYLRARLIREAEVMPINEWLAMAAKNAPGRLSPGQAARLIREQRDSD